jgi:hypothetical protein
LGKEAVVVYTAASGRYSAYGGSQYNTDIDPDITLANDFLVGGGAANEADGRMEYTVNGLARFNALN